MIGVGVAKSPASSFLPPKSFERDARDRVSDGLRVSASVQSGCGILPQSKVRDRGRTPQLPSRSLFFAVMLRAFAVLSLFAATTFALFAADPPGASHLTPNLADNLDRPLRYRPDGADFVIENGAEFFNRPLYGGNTAFRVDGGDRPEFVLYLPGRGGNLRFAMRTASGTKWLHAAAHIVARYRPGELLYEIRDPLLGNGTTLELAVLAYFNTEGLIARATLRRDAGSDSATPADAAPPQLVWAYGGVNGQRGRRDGDIGTENVPIGEWFQLRPEFCRANTFELTSNGFTLHAKPATIASIASRPTQLTLADAAAWSDAAALLSQNARPDSGAPTVVVGRVPLVAGEPFFLSLQRLPSDALPAEDLETYRAVTADGAAKSAPAPSSSPALAPLFAAGDLPRVLSDAERTARELRQRVEVDTPDPFLNAAVGALNIAADAAWDAPQQAIMHGAIAWRTRLLGWRGPYALDALGWHDRARRHFTYWAGRQNTQPIPDRLPPADESANLARNEAGLHSNGDLSNSHYDMNLVAIDALFRHLQWTGDLAFAAEMWPVIERHLAWERRLFRREFGPEKLPLYEAYAAIWASDDLQYGGGGTAHASAYNYYHNQQAARLARLLGHDPAPYEREAGLVARAMRELLWLPERGSFGEFKDLLGLQRVHPSAALWTFYHTMDSGLPTPLEALRMTGEVDREIPHLPVRGPGVPDGLYVVSTSNWMPYRWSINNVVLPEIVHTALGFWQAGRPDEAWTMTKGALLSAMFLGISPGNVGSMSYLDVYRRESQRDFADGSGVLSRALIEGLFGLHPDALAGELRVAPGFPTDWNRASLRHPDLSLRFERTGATDHYVITQRFARPQALRFRLPARAARVASLAVNGDAADWRLEKNSAGVLELAINSPPGFRHEVLVEWAGEALTTDSLEGGARRPRRAWSPSPASQSDEDVGLHLPRPAALGLAPLSFPADARFECVDLSSSFNDRITQIFKNEYRSPRSPFVSLALPKQGLGGWAGGVHDTAAIDDSGLRAVAAQNGGRLLLPGGIPLATPATPAAKNILFTSQWDNYPHAATAPLSGHARAVVLLVAGSTNPMQSRFENGEIAIAYADGTTARLALENPTNWWPIEQDYFIDDFQFRRPEPLPIRVDLKTGRIRVLDLATFEGRGGVVPGGAATVLMLPLDGTRPLRSLTVSAVANEVVIGLMAATLVR